MMSMITLIIWTVAGISVAVYQLKAHNRTNDYRLPPWIFWATYAALMLCLGESALLNAY